MGRPVRIAVSVLALFGSVCLAAGARADMLPQTQPWHRALREYVASLSLEDLEVKPRELPPRPESVSAEEMHKAWLISRAGEGPPNFTTAAVPSAQFTLASIEDEKGIMVPAPNPAEFAWLAQWDDPVNPFYGSEGMKRRAFVAAAVNMIMHDDRQDTDGSIRRSDYLGGTLIYLAYTYLQTKDVVPAEARDAYETGLKALIAKLREWGPTGLMANMDLFAPVALTYASKALGDPAVSAFAEEYSRQLYTNDRYFHPAGYFVDLGCFDTSYNGIGMYFATWCALINDWPFAADALDKCYRLRSHLTLPEPDGNLFGPSHCSSRMSACSPHDQWSWKYRHVGAAMVTDEAMYATPLPTEEELRKAYERLPGSVLSSTPPKPRRWSEDHWIRSIPFVHDHYVRGFLQKRAALEQQNPDLLKPAFARKDDFIRDFEKVFLIAKLGEFGVVIHTGPVGNGLYGLGGGTLSAFWTPQTGSVVLGRRRGAQGPAADSFAQWRMLPVHTISGELADGSVLTTAKIRQPQAKYEVGAKNAEVTVGGELRPSAGEPVNNVAGIVRYQRRFSVGPDGLKIRCTLAGDGKTAVKELYEILPVFLHDNALQNQHEPKPNTQIFFKVGGEWNEATPEPVQATEARIDRWSHSVRIVFDEPASVRLSPEPWMDAYQSRATCRNILIDLLGGQDRPAALGEVGVSYRIDGKPLPRTGDDRGSPAP